MSHDIKKFKPRRNSHYQQRVFNPASAKKLFESQKNEPIIARSSWEARFIIWLEHAPNVRHWGSECVAIQYVKPTDGKVHKYYPDFLVEFTDGSVAMIEIKPHSQTNKPKNMKSKYETEAYVTNMAKWKAAKEFCQQHGIKFSIITEHTIEHLKINK